MKIALLTNKAITASVFDAKALERLRAMGALPDAGALPEAVTEAWMREVIRDADAAVTCWGTPPLSDAVLDAAPGLKLLAHAAGSVRAVINENAFGRGLRVTCAAPVIADDVAETTLGLIITRLKRLDALAARTREGGWAYEDIRPGMLRLRGLTVGVIGASLVGRRLIALLAPFGTRTLVYDPYLTESGALGLGVRKAALDDLFAQSDVVCLHAPVLPSTRKMIGAAQFTLMKDGALFINNARGALVDEEALTEALRSGRIQAAIDVTDPEPPAPDHPLRTLPNVLLTPHIAGGQTINGRHMQGDFIVRQIERFAAGAPMEHEVTREMMAFIA